MLKHSLWYSHKQLSNSFSQKHTINEYIKQNTQICDKASETAKTMPVLIKCSSDLKTHAIPLLQNCHEGWRSRLVRNNTVYSLRSPQLSAKRSYKALWLFENTFFWLNHWLLLNLSAFWSNIIPLVIQWSYIKITEHFHTLLALLCHLVT